MSIFHRFITLIVLQLIGAAVAIYQTYHFYAIRSAATGFRSFCQFGKFDCIAVEASPYAEFLFGLPLSSFVAGWLMASTLLTFFALDTEKRRDTLRVVFGMNVWSVVLGFIYFGIMVQKIGSFCLFCLVIDGVVLLSLFVLLTLKKEWMGGAASQQGTCKTSLITTAVTLVLTLFMLHGAFSQSQQLSHQEIEYVAQKFLNQNVQDVKLRENELAIGPKDAKIVIVKYSDYQCPACEAGARALHLMKYKYPKDIYVVLRNYPLDSVCNPKIQSAMHPYACHFAQASICAEKQGKLNETYTHFFENQSKLSPEWLQDQFEFLGLDKETFQACMSDPKTLEQVKSDLQTGDALQVESTPTFFVNGRKMSGSYPVEVWEVILKKLLAEK